MPSRPDPSLRQRDLDQVRRIADLRNLRGQPLSPHEGLSLDEPKLGEPVRQVNRARNHAVTSGLYGKAFRFVSKSCRFQA
jgi:hypothetical protein